MKRIFYTLSLVALTLGANAQLLLTDNFNYSAPNDSLTGNGWVVGSSGINTIKATGASLSFVGYPAASNGVGSSAQLAASGQDIYKDASGTITSGSAFASFLANLTAVQTTGDYFFGVLPSTSSTTYACRVFAKASTNAGFFNVAINKSNETPVYSSTDFALNTTHLFFVEYKFNTGSTTDDSVYLYVVPNGSAFPTIKPAATAAGYNAAQPDLANVGRVALRQGSASNAATVLVDGLRFGSPWSNGQLPVKWGSFSVAKTTDASILKWSTTSETNNSHFEVQRSADGKNYEAIGKVKGSGNSSKTISYSFTDKEAATSKTTYYRLKQVDFDGKSEYSKTVSVANPVAKAGIGATLPNPFDSDLNITVNATMSASATVVIMDMIGKTHHTSIANLQAGANTINVNTSDMPDGIYFVRVSYNGETFTQKIIKK